MADANETARLTRAQLEAIARASDAAEIAEICKAGWLPPHTAEQMAAQAMNEQEKHEQDEPRKPKFRSVDGFLVPIE